MDSERDDRGRVSGYSVVEDPDGGFRWSAFGPAGSRQGRADSRAAADAAGEAAERELARPRRPTG
jgi:hypothetical protein